MEPPIAYKTYQKMENDKTQPKRPKTQEYEYPALKDRICEKCGEAKNSLLCYTMSIPHVCKTCTNETKRNKRYATGSDPKMKWCNNNFLGKHKTGKTK